MRRRGAVVGRHRPHFARPLEHMRHRGRGRLDRSGFDEQRADAVAIDAEILVAALGNDDFVALRQYAAKAGRILVQAAPEALVGDVDERDQPALAAHVGDLRPLDRVEIGAGRIVAAAVEQRDVAGAALADLGQHVLEADRALSALVIRIFHDLQADGADDRRVIGPARRPQQHSGATVGGRDQLEPQPQRAAAARSLDPGDAVVARMLAEQDRPQQLGKALVAGAAEIGLGHLRIEQPPLGFLHHLEDWRIARGIAENADSDVDLVGPRIGFGHGDQGEQRIADHGRQVGKPPCLGGFGQHAGALSRESRHRESVRRRNRRRRRRRPAPTGRSAHNRQRPLHR